MAEGRGIEPPHDCALGFKPSLRPARYLLRPRLLMWRTQNEAITLHTVSLPWYTLAPQVGFEPTTSRLTADCSTAELLGNVQTNYKRDSVIDNHSSCPTVTSRIFARYPVARGTVITTYFRLLHLRCRPFHPDLTGSSLLPSLTFRWEGVTLQAVPAVPTFLSLRAIVRSFV